MFWSMSMTESDEPSSFGNVDAAPLLVDAESLGARAGRELAHHFELGDVDDVDHVIVAAGDVELACDRR